MNKSQFSILRAVSGIAAMAMIGMLGCFGSELKILFLDGTPFPLVFIVIIGIIMETMALLASVLPYNEMIHEPNPKSLKPAMTYMFGSIAIFVFLALFIIAYDNFMAQAAGGSNNSEWAPVIFMAYIGIMAQMYLMYRVLKKEKIG
jgi:hypothetical protein